jgi:hypothetical protein
VQQNMYTYDPILGQPREPSKFSILEPREAAEPGVALVLLRDTVGLQAVRQPRLLTAGELLFGRIRRIYRVDMTEHKLEWQSWLHSQGDAWVLLAHVQLRCRVSDPVRVVQENVRDAYGVMEPLLAERMRGTIEGYGLQARAEAERAITRDLRQDAHLSEFFELRWVGVRLELDETVMARKRTSMDFAFYMEHLQKGDWAAMGLQLAHDPNAIDGVVGVILQQRKAVADLQLDALKAYLDHGAMAGYQLEPAARQLLHRLAQTWEAAAEGLPAPEAGSPAGPAEPPLPQLPTVDE